MGKTWDVIYERTRELTSISRSLNSLAVAFARTGNEHMANELSSMADAIEESSKEIYSSYTEEQNALTRQGLANSQRFVGKVLKGLLEEQDPKDAVIAASVHNFDRDIVDAQAGRDESSDDA